MTESNKEALREFLRGAALAVVITGGFLLTGLIITRPESKPASKFEIVDRYGGDCAVVRYRPEGRAQDVFFLDCTNAHLRQ